MGKLGFDIVASEFSDDELEFCKTAVSNYHSRRTSMVLKIKEAEE